jgi:hypothetical protein
LYFTTFRMSKGFGMLRRVLVSVLLLSCISFKISAAENILSQPIMFSSDMEQHGSFTAEDLRTSPLLRSMFNLSVNDVNQDFVRICINPKNQCRVIRRETKIGLVASNGQVKFDDSMN